MKILTAHLSEQWQAPEKRTLSEAVGLERLGHRVVMLTVPGSELSQRAREAGIAVREQPVKHAFDPVALKELTAFFGEEKFDVVGANGAVDTWVGMNAARLANVPVLTRTIHSLAFGFDRHLRFVRKWSDAVVTTSANTRNRLLGTNFAGSDRIFHIPTGLDLEEYDPGLDPGPIRKALKIRPNFRVVALVFETSDPEDMELVLDVAAGLALGRTELKFILITRAGAQKEVTALARGAGIGDRLVRGADNTGPAERAALSELAVFAIDEPEELPESLLGFMAASRPVIAPARGLVLEMLGDNRRGLLYPPGDTLTLTDLAARVLDEPQTAEALGREGRKAVEQGFSRESMAKSLAALYKSILDGKSQGSPGPWADGGKDEH